VGAVDDDGGEDSVSGGLRAAVAKGGGVVEGSGGGGVPNRRCEGVGRLRVLLRVWLQHPRRGFLPRSPLLLQA
jgi:hypothetical protein